MEPQTKRTLIATALCMAILFGWLKLMEIVYPPQPTPPNVASAPAESDRAFVEGTKPPAAATPDAPTAAPSAPAEPPGAKGLYAQNAEAETTVVLGDDRQDDRRAQFSNPYQMAVVVTSRGAGVRSVRLSGYRNHVARDKKRPDYDPYDLLSPVNDMATDRSYDSFVTKQVFLVEDKQEIDLEDVEWELRKTTTEAGRQNAELSTLIRSGAEEVLRLTKTYSLEPGSYHLAMDMSIRNLSNRPRKIILTQRGPVGMKNDDPQREFRRIVSAVVEAGGKIVDGQQAMRADLFKRDLEGRELRPGDDRHTLWTALGSKYFACIVTPLPAPGSAKAYAEYLAKVSGAFIFDDGSATDDLTFDQVFSPGPIKPASTTSFVIEVFCGPKSRQLFSESSQAKQRGYEIAKHVDQSGCTFQWLSWAMLWLLTAAYKLVGNYGIAIIILVIIVRTILHPVTKRGQINMMKMQKGMAELKPKLEAIQQQFKNDKQKLNDETMKLYRQEGINPAGQVLGCLPMFLQMPVWIALWTTLNTNVDMRHEPFFWWIRDLSSPDSLIPFSATYTIPLIGAMMGPITSFNLLPIVMMITMYAQQKFTQKLTKPAEPPKPKLDAEGRPIPDPMAQQQKIFAFMTIFFGFLFYNFPSGLNLYILSSNLLGMAEQYRIKKHIREKEARGDFDKKKLPTPDEGPADNGKQSLLTRLAKKAEEARQVQSNRRTEKLKKRKKQPRF